MSRILYFLFMIAVRKFHVRNAKNACISENEITPSLSKKVRHPLRSRCKILRDLMHKSFLWNSGSQSL